MAIRYANSLDEGFKEEVDMTMSTMKPIIAQWMIYLSSHPSIVVNSLDYC